MIFKLIEDLIRNISGLAGIRIRRFYYSNKLAACGESLVVSEGVFFDNSENITLGSNVWIDKGAIFITGEPLRKNIISGQQTIEIGKIKIGDNVHIGIRSILQAHGGIEIGDFFTSGSDSKLYTLSNDVYSSHQGTNNIDKDLNYYRLNPIIIKKNVWVGMQSMILGGVIESDVFIKPNSVCFYNIPKNSIVGGSPAQVIKRRFS